MIRIIPLLLMTLTSLTALGQKSIELPGNQRDTLFYRGLPAELAKYGFEDLTKTQDSLYLRIWHSNKIVEVKKQGKSSQTTLTNWINHEDPIIKKTPFGEEVSQQLLDSLLAHNIVSLPGDPYRGIDGNYVTIEVATPERYQLYSYWSPWSTSSSKKEGAKEVATMIALVNDILDVNGHTARFIETLEPGNYPWGMTGLRIDKFLADVANRSSLYKTVEKRVKNELKITPQTSHRNYPLIIINHQPAFLQDLNKYENTDVKNLEIITKENPKLAIFGSSGSNGIVVVETK